MAGSEHLSGSIERVIFHQQETGFCVLQVRAPEHIGPVNVVGSAACVYPGGWVEATGQWRHDPRHGEQFKAESLRVAAPSNLVGIERYLGSGLFEGIGPVHAKKLVEAFRAEVFEIIEHFSKRLEEVEGIGPERRRRIKQSWEKQKAIRDIMVFLHTHGVSTSLALWIYRTYGEQAMETLLRDPYLLVRDVQGIGFKTADQIAARLRIDPHAMVRRRAGLDYILAEATQQGHVALPQAKLIQLTGKLLGLPAQELLEALNTGQSSGEYVIETLNTQPLVYLPTLHQAEQRVARAIHQLAQSGAPHFPPIDLNKAVAQYEEKNQQRLAPAQRRALEQLLRHRLLIVTGGPGVGKTTLVRSILTIFLNHHIPVALAAPTGRAARRLTESTKFPAKTIHRWLHPSHEPGEPGLDAYSLVIIDETSMVDIILMDRLLSALGPNASLLLIGDADQLPSVGPGRVLADLLCASSLARVQLTEIFRQKVGSRIIIGSQAILSGRMPVWPSRGEVSDLWFIEQNDPEAIQRTVIKLVAHRLPQLLKIDPILDIQVLTPMRRALLGADELNRVLQKTLNPPSVDRDSLSQPGREFRVGDKVMQTRNNYDKEIFNGDMGWVSQISPEEAWVEVQFDDKRVIFEYDELDELQIAYAITVHKSQGSEFPAVVIPLAMQHHILLQRNLLYTAITRGRRMVVIVGQAEALQSTINRAESHTRYGGLLQRLRQLGCDKALPER